MIVILQNDNCHRNDRKNSILLIAPKPKKMRRFLSYLLIFSFLFYFSCNTCGKNENLGKFEVTPQSRERWWPYENMDQLVYENAEGEQLIFLKSGYEENFRSRPVKILCGNPDGFNSASEIGDLEELLAFYSLQEDDLLINFDFNLVVDFPGLHSESFENTNFDRAVFGLTFRNATSNTNSATSIISSDVMMFLADNRGNEIDESEFDNINYLEEIELNGKVYKNVWYSDDDLNIPSDQGNNVIIYIQEGKGVIGFVDIDLVTWTLVE